MAAANNAFKNDQKLLPVAKKEYIKNGSNSDILSVWNNEAFQTYKISENKRFFTTSN